MRLASIDVENFRLIRKERLELAPYTCLVGPNGSGKSTFLHALNVFFRQPSGSNTDSTRLRKEDFYNKDTSQTIRVVLEFVDLSEEEKTDFKHYYRGNKLILAARASWDAQNDQARIEQYGIRLIIRDFAKYFELEKEKIPIAEIRKWYADTRKVFAELPDVTTKPDMEAAIHEYEEGHPDKCVEEESNDDLYGTRGSSKLSRFLSWVYVPAVKDASSEQEGSRASALKELLDLTVAEAANFDKDLEEIRLDSVERYKAVLESKKDSLADLSKSLGARLNSFSASESNLELGWHSEPENAVKVTPPVARVSIGEGDFMGEVFRQGHGVQRLFLVTVLEELARQRTGHPSKLILIAIEEPELYQHPPRARYLSSVLQKLSTQGVQVLITTHSPLFVASPLYESVRLIRRIGFGPATVGKATIADISKRLGDALDEPPATFNEQVSRLFQIMREHQSELFFCDVPVLVEGPEDKALIATHLRCNKAESRFLELGCHFLECSGKKNVSRVLAVAQCFGLNPFVVFDRDAEKKDGKSDDNVKDNRVLQALCGEIEVVDEIAQSVQKDNYLIASPTLLGALKVEIGDGKWNEVISICRERLDLSTGKEKNPILLCEAIEYLHSKGVYSSVLEQLCQKLLTHAEGVRSAHSPSS